MNAPPSPENPLNPGQRLWRFVLTRRGPQVRQALIAEAAHHYVRVEWSRSTYWIDARTLSDHFRDSKSARTACHELAKSDAHENRRKRQNHTS